MWMSSESPGPMLGILPQIGGPPYLGNRVCLGRLCMWFQPVVVFRRRIGNTRLSDPMWLSILWPWAFLSVSLLGLLGRFDGFGGFGYFQGIASHGHVPSFKIVTQLKDTMGFGNSFSNNMIQKINIFLLGIYFNKDIDTCDKVFMKLMNVELIEMIIQYISWILMYNFP